MNQAIYDNALIGVPVYQGMSFGGVVPFSSTDDFVKADYPGLRGIRVDGVFALASGMAETVSIVPKNFGRPLGVLGYAQSTATQINIGTTETDVTGLSVAVIVGTSRRIKITAVTKLSSDIAANTDARFRIKEGSTTLKFHEQPNLDNAVSKTVTAIAVITPSSGAHTYKATLVRIGGTGIINTSNETADPAYVLAEDIGSNAKVAEVELWY